MKKITWEELHALDSLENIDTESLETDMLLCLGLASCMNSAQFILQEARYDLDAAQELGKKLSCYTKIAEYLYNLNLGSDVIFSSTMALQK